MFLARCGIFLCVAGSEAECFVSFRRRVIEEVAVVLRWATPALSVGERSLAAGPAKPQMAQLVKRFFATPQQRRTAGGCCCCRFAGVSPVLTLGAMAVAGERVSGAVSVVAGVLAGRSG